MSSQIIPLTATPNQSFSVQLTVDDKSLILNLTLSYSYMTGYWQLSISSALGDLLVASVPLVTGWYPAANLLAQYQYLKIGSAYLLNTGNAPEDFPSQNTLGMFSLLWGDTV